MTDQQAIGKYLRYVADLQFEAVSVLEESVSYMKVCYKCKIMQEISQFCKDKSKKDGLESRCKTCVREQYLNRSSPKKRIGPYRQLRTPERIEELRLARNLYQRQYDKKRRKAGTLLQGKDS